MIRFYAILALSVSLLGTGWLAWHQRAQNGALRAAVHQQAARAEASESLRKQADEALVRLRQKNAATARETASAQASVEAAKASNRAWADTPVPEEVTNALR